MLVRVLAMAACQCPSVSITSRSSTETAGRIDLVFGMMTSFDLFYAEFQGNSGIYKIRVLSSGTLSLQILDLENFVTACGQNSCMVTPTTVERAVAGCTKFITPWSNVTL